MKFHPDPAPPSLTAYQQRKLANDRQVDRWVERLTSREEDDPALDDPEINVGGLDEEAKKLFVIDEVLKRRVKAKERYALGHWATRQVAPVIKPPTIDDPFTDLEAIFGLPLMRGWARGVLGACPRKRPGRDGGRTANWAGMLLVLIALAAGRKPYVKTALSDLDKMPRVREMFAWAFGVEHIELPAGSTMSRLGPQLAERVIAETKTTMALLYAVLDEFFAPDPTGQVRLTLDGAKAPAWVRQIGAGDRWSHRDLQVRGTLKDAGFRAYVQQGSVKREVNPDTARKEAMKYVHAGAVRAGRVIFWRGYYKLTLCMPRYRGLPRATSLIDASVNEHDGVPGLLSDAVNHEPQLMGAMLITDAGFDIAGHCRGVQVDYDMDPVCRPRKSGKAFTQVKPGEHAAKDTIEKFDIEGQAICRRHERRLEYRGYRRPDREQLGLRPGQEAPEGAFSVRFKSADECNAREIDACGQPSLQARNNWRRLTRYALYPAGNPENYAIRLASLAQLNYHEAYHSRLKGWGHAVGGPARLHVTDVTVVDALFHIADLVMVAATVADRTLRIGQPLDKPSYALEQLHIPGMPQELLLS